MTIYEGESDEAKSDRASRNSQSLRFFSKFYRATPGQAEVGRLLIRGASHVIATQWYPRNTGETLPIGHWATALGNYRHRFTCQVRERIRLIAQKVSRGWSLLARCLNDTDQQDQLDPEWNNGSSG